MPLESVHIHCEQDTLAQIKRNFRIALYDGICLFQDTYGFHYWNVLLKHIYVTLR